MIVREPTHWFKMLFIWRGSVLRKIIVQLSIITLFAILVLYFQGRIYAYKVHLNPAIFTLIGLALAIFMGFCNSASYDRFWEGRKLWGSLVIESRSFTRQILTVLSNKDVAIDQKQDFIKMNVAFSWALNYQLRSKNDDKHLQRLLTKEQYDFVKNKRFKPIAILDLMASYINTYKEKGYIDTMVWTSLNRQLNQLSGIVGGCERIVSTPLPFSYYVLLHRTVYFYCFLLPFGLVDAVDWMMPVIVFLISYTFIALDALIKEIGEPFGEEENDLALNELCNTIEFSLFEQANIPQRCFEKSDDFFRD